MSRIHEAIRKAVKDHQPGVKSSMTTVDEILSTSSKVAGRLNAGRPQLASDTIRVSRFRHEMWRPDEKRVLFCREDSNASAREQFRSMRTKLIRFHSARNIKVVAIGSALSGEGKTFVATNLAYALAAQGDSSVLLIDTDLRRGCVADMLGAPTIPGLAEHLLKEISIEDVIQTGPQPHLYVLPSGARVAEPGELIANARFSRLISECRFVFDWVLVDTPPVIQFSDASTIASFCDAVLLVVKGATTPVQLAKRALEAYSEHVVLGAVLNHAEIDSSVENYYNYY